MSAGEEQEHGTDRGSKKNKVPIDAEAIEIDVNADIPLSKKAQRQLKKGKSRAEVEKLPVIPKEFLEDPSKENEKADPLETSREGRLRRAQENTEKKQGMGVWGMDR